MLEEIIDNALREDIGEGDHSTLACVPKDATGVAQLIVKEAGVLAGVELAQKIFDGFEKIYLVLEQHNLLEKLGWKDS